MNPDFEVDLFAGMVRGRMAREPGYTAVQNIPRSGPTLAAVFVAEIGDITRFASAPKLTCWAGLTPKHHESDTHVHRGRITKQGSRLVRWKRLAKGAGRSPDEMRGSVTAGSTAIRPAARLRLAQCRSQRRCPAQGLRKRIAGKQDSARHRVDDTLPNLPLICRRHP
jgi:transposase